MQEGESWMKVTYVYHSCFVVELTHIVLIFDYFKGELPPIPEEKPILMFASHKHHDHFSLDVFGQFPERKNVSYVLSNDIRLSKNYFQSHQISDKVMERVKKVGKNQTYTFDIEGNVVEVETFTSTDEGVAYLIKAEGKTIYHAGDLNWWTWIGESEQEYAEMTHKYKEEIAKLSNRKIDLAMVVLDPRQEERYDWGFDYFMKNTKTEQVIPMHCWEKYEVMQRFLGEEKAREYANRVCTYSKEGEVLDLHQ